MLLGCLRMSSAGNNTSNPQERSAGDHNNDVNMGQIFMQSALVIAIFVTSLLILIIIGITERLRRNINGQLLASLAFSGILFGIFIRPATIQMGMGGIYASYCPFYLFLVKTEWIFLPYVLWIISLERIIALNQPENYSKHFGPTGRRVALISSPWIIGFSFALLATFLPGTNIHVTADPHQRSTINHGENIANPICYADYSAPTHQIVHYLWLSMAVAIPIFLLSITTAALVVVYVRRSGVTVKCDDVPLVENGSVVYSLLLDLAVVIVLIVEAVVLLKGFKTLVATVHSHWYGGILELTAGVVGLVTLPDIRKGLFRTCGSGCCRGKEDESIPLTPAGKAQDPKY